MVFEGELAVELHAKDVEVGTCSDRNSRQNQVTMGRAHSPGSASDQLNGNYVFNKVANKQLYDYLKNNSILPEQHIAFVLRNLLYSGQFSFPTIHAHI